MTAQGHSCAFCHHESTAPHIENSSCLPAPHGISPSAGDREVTISQLSCPAPVTACSPGIKVCHWPQELWAGEEVLELCPDLLEMRPPGTVVCPAALHQLVEDRGAVHGRWQPVPFLQAFHDLHREQGQVQPREQTVTEDPETSVRIRADAPPLCTACKAGNTCMKQHLGSKGSGLRDVKK